MVTGVRSPFLIIAPLSTIANWEREFRTWTDMNAIVYHGSLTSRHMIQQFEMYYRDEQVHAVAHVLWFVISRKLNIYDWHVLVVKHDISSRIMVQRSCVCRHSRQEQHLGN